MYCILKPILRYFFIVLEIMFICFKISCKLVCSDKNVCKLFSHKTNICICVSLETRNSKRALKAFESRDIINREASSFSWLSNIKGNSKCLFSQILGYFRDRQFCQNVNNNLQTKFHKSARPSSPDQKLKSVKSILKIS